MIGYTVDDFKTMFYRDRNFIFQPYPTWIKTIYDKDEITKKDGLYYQSLIDLNYFPVINNAYWKQLVRNWESFSYKTEQVVILDNILYKCLTDNVRTIPGIDNINWEKMSSIYRTGTYNTGDIVHYYNDYYRCLSDDVIIEPTDTQYWEKIDVFKEFKAQYWVDPVYQKDDIVLYKDSYYKSNINDNTVQPEPDEIIDPNFGVGEPAWTKIDITTIFSSEIEEYNTPIFYNNGDKVIYRDGFNPYAVYQSGEDKNYTVPISDFWAKIDEDAYQYILDADIEKAMGEANFKFNENLFPDKEQAKIAYSYLVAFFLIYDLQTAQGGTGSSSSYPIASRSVGKMSVSYSIPSQMEKYPSFYFLSKNAYGLKYFELLRPYLVASITIFKGNATNF